MDTLSTISSVCTVILFLLYIIGRIVLVLFNRSLFTERIEFYTDDEMNENSDDPTSDISSKYRIIDEDDITQNEDDNPGTLMITSIHGIRNIMVLAVNTETDELDKRGAPLYVYKGLLDPGMTISLRVNTPECQRYGVLVVITNNYEKWELDLEDYGLDGVTKSLPTEEFKQKITIKTILYALLK